MRIEIKFCPRCRSEDVVVDGRAIEFSTGAMMCKNCGFSDIVFPMKVKEELKDKTDKKR